MKRFNIEAIVLKNVNYKDSHRIYTLLTREKGKISAIARGVRKISSKRSGSLDTLNQVSLNLSEDKGGYYSINEVKTINSFSALKNSLDFVLAGMYFCELVDIFLDSGHEASDIYTLLKSGLTVLSKNPSKAKMVVNVFEFRLLDKLGFGITVDSCVICGKDFDETWGRVKVNSDLGGFICDTCPNGGIDIPPRAGQLFYDLQFEKNLAKIFEYDEKFVSQVDKILKSHLKHMVEANARFPKINSFLTKSVE
jgi:DNA repair protein RecO (recombination protein O)